MTSLLSANDHVFEYYLFAYVSNFFLLLEKRMNHR